MSSTTNATSSAISIFPHNRQGHSQSQSQAPSQTYSQAQISQRRTTVTAATTTAATKPLPMVGVGVGIGVDIDIDYDMSMSMGMGMNMNMGMGMGAGDLDIRMGSYRGIDMDIAMSADDQQQQHLMSWSPRPTNSFQNRFYPGASPGSLFNPIAMPAPNLSSSPIPINSRKSTNNAITTITSAKPSNSTSKFVSSSKRAGRSHYGHFSATNIGETDLERGGYGNGDGEGEEGSGGAEDGVAGSEEEDNPDLDRDSEAPNSLTVSTQGGNYVCCGITLPDLHALVDHFENAHVQVFASPSLEALSGVGMGMGGAIIPASGAIVSAASNANTVPSSGGASTPVVVTSAVTARTTSSSTSSPYEFPAPPFDTDDMDISLSDDGPSPSPPLTPANTPSPTTSAFDPIRVVYHPAGVNMGMGGVGSGASTGVGVGYGAANMRGTGATFSMGGYGMGMGTQYLSPTNVLSVSSSSSSNASASASSVVNADVSSPFFRPSTYSSLAGGNGPIMNMNHTSLTTAFNRYAGYSDYSSQLPGTDPSPTYPYSSSTSMGKLHGHGGGAGSGSGSSSGYHHLGSGGGMAGTAAAGFNPASSASSCVPPALLFSSSAEPSPLNTPSSSRTGSPVEGQTQGHNTLPKGTLPLHPSSSGSGPTSVAPSKRTPQPSSLQSTANAAGASSSSTHHPLSKPFKCPKPGCNKSYKQQNGLKYHLSHGQCNFAPRDPEVEKLTEQEREKRIRPFVCKVPIAVPSSSAGSTGTGVGGNNTGGSASTSVTAAAGAAVTAGVNGSNGGVYVECGRRYKNMNGLRYHYQHTGEHGAIGLEMLAQGRHPLPDLPSVGPHSHTHSNSSSTTPSRPTSGVSTPTSPSTPNISATRTTTPITITPSPSSPPSNVLLPTINTSVLSPIPSFSIPHSASSTSASTPFSPSSSSSSPHASPSPVLSVPPTPITPSPISPHHHPHPLRISSSSASLSSSSVSMPPSPSRHGSGVSGVYGTGANVVSGVSAGFAALSVGMGKSISYPSSPVSASFHGVQHTLSPILGSTSPPTTVQQQPQQQQNGVPVAPVQTMPQPMQYPTSAYGFQYPTTQ